MVVEERKGKIELVEVWEIAPGVLWVYEPGMKEHDTGRQVRQRDGKRKLNDEKRKLQKEGNSYA